MAVPTRPSVPAFFYPILWSYDPAKLDVGKDKRLFIVQAINYGDLKHWRWLIATYGKEVVRDTLATVPASEIRPRAERLAALLFDTQFNHASRGSR